MRKRVGRKGRVVRSSTPAQRWAQKRFELLGSLRRIQTRSKQLSEEAERVVGSGPDLCEAQACLGLVELNAGIAFGVVKRWRSYKEVKKVVEGRRVEDG